MKLSPLAGPRQAGTHDAGQLVLLSGAQCKSWLCENIPRPQSMFGFWISTRGNSPFEWLKSTVLLDVTQFTTSENFSGI